MKEERKEGEEPPIWVRQDEERSRYVRGMFALIAHRYDLLNSVLSLRLHHRWRRWATLRAQLKPGDWVLDVCSGTGDFAFELARAVGPTGLVVAADFCEPMLRIAIRKAAHKRLSNVHPVLADALSLPFPDNTFAAVTVGFGLRNVIDPLAALREMTRVVRPGGRVICLELSCPRHPLIRTFYDFYALRLLPWIGGLLSQREAYEYLPNSIQHFAERETLAHHMQKAGLAEVEYHDLTLGVVCVHIGVKPCLLSAGKDR